MRLVVQRAKSSKVEVHYNPDGPIEKQQTRTMGDIPQGGFMVLVGFTQGDTTKTCQAMAKKLVGLRLFSQTNPDGTSKDWAANVVEKQLKLLLVSQFTLFAKLKGTKPDFHHALNPVEARELYYYFVQQVRVEYLALAKKIADHPIHQLKSKLPPITPANPMQYDYTALDSLIQAHFEEEAKLPVDERHGEAKSMATIKGLEVYCFDEFVHTTQFGSYMSVHLVNDGPVTLILDSPQEVVKVVRDKVDPPQSATPAAVSPLEPTQPEIEVSIQSSQSLTDATIAAISRAVE